MNSLDENNDGEVGATEQGFIAFFQYHNHPGLFEEARSTLQELLVAIFPDGADFDHPYDQDGRDAIVERFIQLDGGKFVAHAPWNSDTQEDANLLVRRCVSLWISQLNRSHKEAMMKEKAQWNREALPRPQKRSFSDIRDADDEEANLIMDLEPTENAEIAYPAQQRLPQPRLKAAKRTTARASRGSPLECLNLSFDRSGRTPVALGFDIVLFIVRSNMTKGFKAYQATDFQSETVPPKAIHELTISDLSFDKFIERCTADIGFDRCSHKIYWKVTLNGKDETFISADDEHNWHIAIRMQCVNQGVYFWFDRSETILRGIQPRVSAQIVTPQEGDADISMGNMSLGDATEPATEIESQAQLEAPKQQSAPGQPQREEVEDEQQQSENDLSPAGGSSTGVIDLTHEETPPPLEFEGEISEERRMAKALKLPGEAINKLYSHGGGMGHLIPREVASSAYEALLGEEGIASILEDNISDQYDVSIARDLCEFLGIEFDEFLDRDKRFPIPGTKRRLFGYQLYAAWWVFLKRHEPGYYNRGVFMADGVGFGKTIQAITAVFFQITLNEGWQQYNEPQEDNSDGMDTDNETHIRPGQTSDRICNALKTNSNWMFCPCSFDEASVGHRRHLQEHEGPVLIVAPPTILLNWIDEIEKHVDIASKDAHRIKLYLAYDVKESIWKELQQRGVQKFTSQSVKHFTTDERGNPQRGQMRYWVLTSYLSFNSRVFEVQGASKIKWSTVILDEFHLVSKGPQTILNRKLRNNELGKPFHIYLSATPVEKDTSDILGPIQAMQGQYFNFSEKGQPSWRLTTEQSIKDALQQINPMRILHNKSALKKLQNRAERDELSDEDQQDFEVLIGDARTLFSQTTIKRNPTSNWGGRPCLKLPRLRVFDVPVDPPLSMEQALKDVCADMDENTNQKVLKAQARWDQNWGHRKREAPFPRPTYPTAVQYKNAGRLARIAATFPFFATKMLDSETTKKWDIDWGQETAKEIWQKRQKHWIWKNHARDIFENSPKVQMLLLAIKEMRKHTDCQGDPRKGLIFTFSPFTAAIMFLCFKTYVKEEAVWISAQTVADERANTVAEFQQNNDEGPRWLIGTPDILGVGLTCTKASVCFMMEPQFTLKQELQAYGRINRTALVQPELTTFAYRLLLKGNRVEETLEKRKTDRSILQRQSFQRAPGQRPPPPL